MPKFGPPPTRTRRHSAAQARSLQQLQASARAALSSAGMVDWPLPIRALSLLFCIGAILADLVIVGFTGTWLVDAAVYRYNHAIGASGLSYNMTFSVLNTSIEWDLALPPIRNGTSSLAGSIDGLEEGGAADLGSFVLHAYALVLLGLLAMANARHRKAPHYFHSPGFLFFAETGLGLFHSASVLALPREREWHEGTYLDTYLRSWLFWLRFVAGCGLGAVGVLRLVGCCCVGAARPSGAKFPVGHADAVDEEKSMH